MERTSTFNSMKEIEAKTMTDMVFLANIEGSEVGLGSSVERSLGPSMKPRKKEKKMTSLYPNFFETATDGESRRCKFCKQSYSIVTATGHNLLGDVIQVEV